MAKFTVKEILMGRITTDELPPESVKNLHTLVERLNAFFAPHPAPIRISSGYRTAGVNANLAGAAKQSLHLVCAAADLADPDGAVWLYCLQNLPEAAKLGLWLEDKRWTPTWVHLQIYAPRSGRRIYVPNSKPPMAPHLWNGQYDGALDGK